MIRSSAVIAAVGMVVLVMASAGCVATSPAGNGQVTPIQPAGTVFPGANSSAGAQVALHGDTVSVYYTGRFENGTVFDTNTNRTTPAVFTLGNGSVIEGFEDAVTGMELNEEKTVFIPAAKAYGIYNASLVRTVPRTGPIANTTFTVGQDYYIHDRTTDAVSIVRILNVTSESVTWDANDPLADQNFTFTIRLTGIRKP